MATSDTMLDCQPALDALAKDDDWGVRAAQLLLAAAHGAGCSDLHLLARREDVLVRGRRDGDFVPMGRVPSQWRQLLVARLKVLANLPGFVRHEPQDGRIEWRPAGTREGEGGVMLRASFLPTVHGESVVIRFPEKTERRLRIDELGMSAAVTEGITQLADAPEGTLLLTGPSGSGKTTTLYALLDYINQQRGDRCHVVTIEDPVERDLGFAAQVQVSEAQGVTFDRALRAALRQDPNVLLVGEIRDADTARVAVQAGMTGHLVLSTLHAGRAARVYTRLLSMGIEPYLAASALIGSVAQRLARRLCGACSTPAPAGGGSTAAGCDACAWSGHRGRTALFEVAPMTEPLRELMLARAAPSLLATEAARRQRGDLVRDGLELVAQGVISRGELESIVTREEVDR